MKDKITRRTFFKKCAKLTVGFCVFSNFIFKSHAKEINNPLKKEAMFWTKKNSSTVKCLLCPNSCVLQENDIGRCNSRKNISGKLYSLNYGLPSIIALDYIEKSPLYHYQIEGKAFSIATAGCNLGCRFCQNWKYSQFGPGEVENYELSPKEVVSRAKKNNVKSINFFYTEPTIYYEYMTDIAMLAKKEKMKTICVTAGYINKEPLLELIPYIDAFVIGLKGFDDSFYKNYIGCVSKPITDTIKTLKKNNDKTWLEIVNLIVPGLNDDEASIRKMAKWIYDEIGADVPFHFTRFEPHYKLDNLNPTPISTLKKAHTIAKNEGLNYVYLGNIPGITESNTFCPGCGKTVIERVNFKVIKNDLKSGVCSCGYKIPGHWL